MSAVRPVRVFFVLAVLVAVAGAGWEFTREQTAQSTLDSARAAEAALRDATLRLNVRLSALHAKAKRAEQELSAARAAADGGKGRSRAAAGATRKPSLSIARRLHDDPKFQLLWLEEKRATVLDRYGLLFHRLHLTDAAIATFVKNVAARDEARMDLDAIVNEQLSRDGKVSPEVATLIQRGAADYEAAQRALLGAAGWEEVARYEREDVARSYVDGWAGGMVVAAGDPLTREQGERLIAVIAAAMAQKRTTKAAQLDWDKIDADVRGFLSPRQMAVFETMEPSLPWGARFQSQLYGTISAASASEVPPAKPSGAR